MEPITIDLNADLGEGYPFDAELMDIVTSANICSGAYISDEDHVRSAIVLATEADVRIGIHVGYPDIERFGRVAAFQSPRDFESALHRQVDQFLEMVESANGSVFYLKPHGALYHDLIPESDLWDVLFKVCDTHGWPLMHLADSNFLKVAATVAGAVNEAFIDRRYATVGSLEDRSLEGAVITDEEEVLAQAVSIATGKVILSDGIEKPISAQSLCLHGDTPGALTLASSVKERLHEKLFMIAPFI
ncbi:MAG: LamB/YcsF family protein [Saprospiraceae bacterium]